MGYIWAIYYLYLLTYYFRFRSGTRVPVVLPVGYPGNKLPGYGSPIHDAQIHKGTIWRGIMGLTRANFNPLTPTVAIWVQLILLCQTGLKSHL